MGRNIQLCKHWEGVHERPPYTFDAECPSCGGQTRPAAPPRYNPDDPYGEYRRSFIRRIHQNR